MLKSSRKIVAGSAKSKAFRANSRRLVSATFVVALPAFSSISQAQTWTGATDGNWATSTNWNPALPGFTNTTDLVWGSNGFLQPNSTIGAARTIRSLTFNDNVMSNVGIGLTTGSSAVNLSIGGAGGAAISVTSNATGNITIGSLSGSTNGVMTLLGNLTVDHLGSGTLLFNRNFGVSAFGVTKTGSGVMRTANQNLFTGAMNVNGGRWIVSAAVVSNDLDQASAVNLGGGTIEIQTNSITKTFNVPINVNAASTFVYNNIDSTDRTLTLQTNAITLNADLSLLNTSNTANNNFIQIARTITGSGRLIYSANNTFTSLTSDPLSGRRGQLSVGTLGNAAWTGGLTIARGQFTVNAPNTAPSNLNYTDLLGTSSSSLEIGASTFGALLSFNNGSFTSVTIPSSIIVQSGGFRAIRNGGDFATNITFSGAVTLNNDLTVAHEVNNDRFITFSGIIQGAGGLNITRNGTANGSRVRLTGASANTFTGITTIYGNGGLQIGQDGHLGTVPVSPTAGRLVLDSGTLYSTASFTLNANRGIALGPSTGTGAGTMDVSASRTLTYDGIIANNGLGTGQLFKTNSGTLSLGGANTYSGATTVAGGTLLLENTSGSATGVGDITVNAGATLGGNGRATGAATVNGFLAPGSGVGDIELGSLTMASTSQLTLEVDTISNAADAVITQGGVSIAPGAALQLSFVAVSPGPYANTFVVVNNQSTATTTGTFNTLPSVGGLLQYTVNYGVNYDADGQNNDITITFTSVPEPGMLSLFAAASMGLLRRRRMSSVHHPRGNSRLLN